jgi:hypothetical protein
MKPDVCKNLRTKSMFIPALAHQGLNEQGGEDPSHSPHCWCTCTLTETGPDDKPVGMQVCKQNRSCFEE